MKSNRLSRFALLGLAILTATYTAHASPIFTVNLFPTITGLTFANSVSNFTMPVQGAGAATNILGAPDNFGGADPNQPGMVDFGGGNLNAPWAVTVGFGSTFTDGSGVDVKVFGTQLNLTEGWNLFASADGATFTLLGTFAPAAEVMPYFSIDVDFNGAPVPAGALFLRFEGTQVPIDNFTRGFDFDAVGVVAAAAVPEPDSFALIVLGLASLVALRLFDAPRRKQSL